MIIELKVVKKVAGGTRECDTFVPPAGKILHLLSFHGEGAFDPNCTVKLIWIFDHATETEDALWTIKGSSRLPESYSPMRSDANGVRKIGLCLDNGLVMDVYMSGYARIWVED